MKLQPKVFTQVVDGNKTIESRLFDEKRQKISIGDTIIFSREPENIITTHTKVVDIFRARNFEELVSKFSSTDFGNTSQSETLAELSEFYSEKDQEKYGVVGFKLKVISSPAN